jgi:hypothetical protein
LVRPNVCPLNIHRNRFGDWGIKLVKRFSDMANEQLERYAVIGTEFFALHCVPSLVQDAALSEANAGGQ